jgi:hypothetical protein
MVYAYTYAANSFAFLVSADGKVGKDSGFDYVFKCKLHQCKNRLSHRLLIFFLIFCDDIYDIYHIPYPISHIQYLVEVLDYFIVLSDLCVYFVMGNCRSYDGVTHDKYAGPSDVQKSSPHMMVHDGSILGLSYWNEALAIASDNKEISVHSLPTLLSDTDYLGSYMKGHEKAVNRLSFHLQTGKLWSASRDLSIRMVNIVQS